MRVFEVSAEQVEQLKQSGQIKETIDLDLPASQADELIAVLTRLAARSAGSAAPAVKTRLEVWRDGKPFVCGTCCPMCLLKDPGMPEGSYELMSYPDRVPDAPRQRWGRLDVYQDGIAVMRAADGTVYRRDSL